MSRRDGLILCGRLSTIDTPFGNTLRLRLRSLLLNQQAGSSVKKQGRLTCGMSPPEVVPGATGGSCCMVPTVVAVVEAAAVAP